MTFTEQNVLMAALELSGELARLDTNNDFFGPVDAEVYYTFISLFAPRRIIEVGSGYSTEVAQKAISNSRAYTDLVCIDPEPRKPLSGIVKHIPHPVQGVGTRVFEGLEDGDFLFIDSTHIDEPGSDVDYLYRSVIPYVKPGVVIHVHDIFLGTGYPKFAHWTKFNEQPLVEGLIKHHEATVIWDAHKMHRKFPSELSAAFGSYDPFAFPGPGSIWMVKE